MNGWGKREEGGACWGKENLRKRRINREFKRGKGEVE